MKLDKAYFDYFFSASTLYTQAFSKEHAIGLLPDNATWQQPLRQ
jgi:hypothetical protein